MKEEIKRVYREFFNSDYAEGNISPTMFSEWLDTIELPKQEEREGMSSEDIESIKEWTLCGLYHNHPQGSMTREVGEKLIKEYFKGQPKSDISEEEIAKKAKRYCETSDLCNYDDFIGKKDVYNYVEEAYIQGALSCLQSDKPEVK